LRDQFRNCRLKYASCRWKEGITWEETEEENENQEEICEDKKR